MAVSNILVSPPPRDTPFFTAGNRISEVWLSWMSSITATATIVQNLQTLNVIAEDNSTDANMAAILTELFDAIALGSEPHRAPAADPDPVTDLASCAALRAEVEELRNLVEAIPSLAVLRAEVEELRALVSAGDPAPFGALSSVLTQFGGVSGTLTIPKLTTANGSLTLANGVVTAFVQPT